MKLKTIASAIATVGILASAQSAFAVLTPSSTPALSLYVAGASAQDQQFRRLFANLCDAPSAANSNDALIYLARANAIPDSAQQAFMCRMSSAKVPGLPASPGIVVAVYKRSEGGSGFGVGPVAGSSPIDFLNKSTCSASATGTVDGFNLFGNCTGVTQVAPDAGISDVEPAMLNKSPNLIDASLPENADIAVGDPGTVPVSLAGLTVLPLNATTFGVPVTLGLYRALQVVQGKTQDDRVENMPSLSREQVASIMSGQGGGDWSNFTVKNGATTVALTSFPGVTAPGSTTIEICRRSPGSGTQAQFNALFSNSTCSTAAVDPARDNTEFTSRLNNTTVYNDIAEWINIGTELGRDGILPNTPAVHEGQGSGDVANCLDRLEDNQVWGLGVSSLERGSNKWRFIKLNGAAPTLENVAKNNYFDWAVGTMQYKTSLTGQKLSVLTAIKNETGSPAILDAINRTLKSRIKVADNLGFSTASPGVPNDADASDDDAAVGIVALRTASVNPTAPFLITNPVMTAVREKGGSPNTCATATVKSTSTQKTELDTGLND